MIIQRSKNYGKKEPISDGVYSTTILNTEILKNQTVKNKQTDVLRVTFGLNDDLEVFNRYPISGDSGTLFDSLVKASIGKMPQSFDTDDLIDCKLLIKVRNVENNGVIYTNVVKTIPLPDDKPEEIDEDLDLIEDFDSLDEDEVDIDDDEPPATFNGRRRHRLK